MAGGDEHPDDVYGALNTGLAHYHAGKFFEAHEVWEDAWLGEVGRTKLALQALIQIAAALHKHQVENPRGTAKLLAKARDKIAEVQAGAAAWLGIDFVGLGQEVERALAEADAIAADPSRGGALRAPALPRTSGPDGIIYLHGFASGPTSTKAALIVPPLVARGLHVAVPDLNEDDFPNLTVSRALARVRRELRDRTVLIGSSLGGYIAALVAARDERVKALVLMAPAFGFLAYLSARHGPAGLARWKAEGQVEVEHHVLRRKVPLRHSFYEDALSHEPSPRIRVPAYVLQGRRDDTVDPAVVEAVARGNPDTVTLDLVDDDHGLTASASRALAAAERFAVTLQLRQDPSSPDIATFDSR